MSDQKKNTDNKISIIIPTYNEKENIIRLIPMIHQVMTAHNFCYECILVDDNSTDGTYTQAMALVPHYPLRCYLRTQERGLSSAIWYGFQQAQGDILGCIDADLQHDPQLIPQLVSAIQQGQGQMVIASRYLSHSVMREFPWHRKLASLLSRWVAKPLTPITDCMSGYFFIHSSVIENIKVNLIGYKLGLELQVKGKHQGQLKEIPSLFTARHSGQSKMTLKIIMGYFYQLFLLYLYKLRHCMDWIATSLRSSQ